MGLLPLASVEPENISSSFYMEIEVGHEVSPPSLFNLGATKADHVDVALITPEGAELCLRCAGRGSAARGMGQQATVLSTLVCFCRQERRSQDQEWLGLNCEWASSETDLSGNRSHHSGPHWMATDDVVVQHTDTDFFIYSLSYKSFDAGP